MNPLLDTLRALEAELHHPGVRCSPERLEQLLHPGFHEVGRSGRRYTRDTVIAFLAAESEQPDVLAEDYAVTALADDCALLTYRSADRGPEGLQRHTFRSSIWRRTPAGWQLFHHQGTPTEAWSTG